MELANREALIFDSDGVLVNSEVIHIAVERELLAELGLTYDYVTYVSRFVGLSNPDFYASLRADYAALDPDTLPDKCSNGFPDDFADRLLERTIPRMEAELTAIDGVAQLVKAFARPVAVASSAPIQRLTRKLTITGLKPLFEPHLYSADHVEHGKPAPDIFLHAAEKLGVPASKCAVIEDSVNGIKAARAAGMFAIGFTGGGHADPGLADRLTKAGAHEVVDNHETLAARCL